LRAFLPWRAAGRGLHSWKLKKMKDGRNKTPDAALSGQNAALIWGTLDPGNK